MLSILIPAYRNLACLIRLMSSLERQRLDFEYEIIISDDSTPFHLNLDTYVSNSIFKERIKVIKQSANLGVLGNLVFLSSVAKYRYRIFPQHDDYYVDDLFLQRCLTIFQSDQDVAFIFANANFENSKQVFFEEGVLGTYFDGPRYLTGEDFSKCFWNPLMTSWSSIVFDNQKLSTIGQFGKGYTINPEEAEVLSVYPQEEGMSFLYLLATCGTCVVDPSVVSVRGLPPTRFSISPNHPGRGLKNDVCFFMYVNVFSQLASLDDSARRVGSNALETAIKRFGLAYIDKRIFLILRARGLSHTLIIHALLNYRRMAFINYLRLLYHYLKRFLQLSFADPKRLLRRMRSFFDR
jgi:hypothetical protein